MCLLCFQTTDTFTQSIRKADSLNIGRKFNEAVLEYEKVINAYPQINISETDLAHSHLQKGVCYFYLGKLDSSLICYFEALKIFERKKNIRQLAITTSNISNIYYFKEDFGNAEKYLNYSLSYSKISMDSSQLERLLLQKGLLLHGQGKTQDAIQLYKTQLNYNFESNNPFVARYYNNLGHFYFSIDYDSSLHYFLLAEQKGEQLDNSLLYATYSNIGNIYFKRRTYRKALEYFDKSLKSPEMDSDSTVMLITYRALSNVYDSMKIYDSALLYLKKASEIESKLNAADKIRANKELSEKYESDKKDEKIRTQETENKLKTRNLLLSLGGLALAAALAIISFISYKRKQRANKILQAQKEKIETLNKDLDVSNQVKTKLFSVISHDLRSPISGLYAYLQLKTKTTGKNDNVIIEQTEQLLETLEDLLVWSKSQLHHFVPIEQPVWLYDLCNQIISLTESFTRERLVNITNQIQPDLSISSDPNMLTIILRNLISNAVKYARPHTAIIIDAERRNNDISVSVSNETDIENASLLSTAAEPTVTSNKSGLGITLVKEFVTKLKGSFSYTVNQNKVTTTITLPV